MGSSGFMAALTLAVVLGCSAQIDTPAVMALEPFSINGHHARLLDPQYKEIKEGRWPQDWYSSNLCSSDDAEKGQADDASSPSVGLVEMIDHIRPDCPPFRGEDFTRQPTALQEWFESVGEETFRHDWPSGITTLKPVNPYWVAFAPIRG